MCYERDEVNLCEECERNSVKDYPMLKIRTWEQGNFLAEKMKLKHEPASQEDEKVSGEKPEELQSFIDSINA